MMRYSLMAIMVVAVLLMGCTVNQDVSGGLDTSPSDSGDSSSATGDSDQSGDGSGNEATGDAVLPEVNESSEDLVDDDLDEAMANVSMDGW
mgnify:CR=1 FL=1